MKKTNERRKNLLSLTLSATLAATGVALLFLGSLFDVATLSVVALVSLLSLFAKRELPIGYAVAVFFVTGALALLLLGQKEGAFLYLLFGGWYPLVKAPLDRLPLWLSLLIKALLFNAAALVYEYLAAAVLGIDALSPLFTLLVLALANAVFFLFDVLLCRIAAVYEVRLRPSLHRLLPLP